MQLCQKTPSFGAKVPKWRLVKTVSSETRRWLAVVCGLYSTGLYWPKPPKFSKETKYPPKFSKEATSFGEYFRNGRSYREMRFSSLYSSSLSPYNRRVDVWLKTRSNGSLAAWLHSGPQGKLLHFKRIKKQSGLFSHGCTYERYDLLLQSSEVLLWVCVSVCPLA